MLVFFTLSLDPKTDVKSVWRKIRKLFKDSIRMSVWELGKNNKRHYHAIMDIPKKYIDNKSVLAKQVGFTEVSYGTKYVLIKSVKMEQYYVGYMQKEMFEESFLGCPVKDAKRIIDCIYGEGYLSKAWEYYLKNKDDVKNGVNNKERYSGTLLAMKIYDFAMENNYKNFLEAVYAYSEKHKVDIIQPQSLATMCLDLRSMKKPKK